MGTQISIRSSLFHCLQGQDTLILVCGNAQPDVIAVEAVAFNDPELTGIVSINDSTSIWLGLIGLSPNGSNPLKRIFIFRTPYC
jgi:hypothetical protein